MGKYALGKTLVGCGGQHFIRRSGDVEMRSDPQLRVMNGNEFYRFIFGHGAFSLPGCWLARSNEVCAPPCLGWR